MFSSNEVTLSLYLNQSNVMDNDRAGITPSSEDKSRYEAARKELMQALQKKRIVDKQLVRVRHGDFHSMPLNFISRIYRHSSRFKYTILRTRILQIQHNTVVEILYKDLMDN